MNNNFYHVLEIGYMATKQEVREAYARKIRICTPETNPEQFKRIREAYEVLSDESLRRNYDTMLTYGDEINQLLNLGHECMENREFEQAESAFKKVLLYNSHLHHARNLYALALSYQDDRAKQEKSVQQFKKLVELEPNKAVYHTNLGTSLNMLGQTEEAIRAMKQGISVAPDDIDVLFCLVNLYIEHKQFAQAASSIKDRMHTLHIQDFSHVLLVIKLLEIHIAAKDKATMNMTFNMIDLIISYNNEQKEQITNQLVSLIYKLVSQKNFEYAKLLYEKGCLLSPNDDRLIALSVELYDQAEVYSEYEKFKDDTAIIGQLKAIYVVYLFGDEVSNEEFSAISEQSYKNLYNASRYGFNETIASIKRVFIHYPRLYESRKAVLEKTMNTAKTHKQLDSEYVQMKEDHLIAHGIKRLIALYLSSNLTEEEHDEYLEDIWDEIEEYSKYSISQSFRRLRQYYPQLYGLHSEFFDELI